MLSFLILVVVVLIVAGVILWGVTQLPLDATLQRLIKVVVIVGVVLWLVYELYTRFAK